LKQFKTVRWARSGVVCEARRGAWKLYGLWTLHAHVFRGATLVCLH